MELEAMEDVFNKYKNIVFDLNGVIWSKNLEVYPCIGYIVNSLNISDTKNVYFMTNSKRCKEELSNLLVNKGVYALPDQIFSYGDCVVDFVEKHPNAKIFITGCEEDNDINTKLENTLSGQLEDANIFILNNTGELTDFQNILKTLKSKHILTISKNEYTYGKYSKIIKSYGCDVKWIGKPHSYIFDMFLKTTGVDLENTVLVGNKLHTDVLGCKKSGMNSALLLNRFEDNSHWLELELETSYIKPDHVVELHYNI